MTTKEQTLHDVAKIELDRLAELYKQAGQKHEESIGKMGEQFAYDYAMSVYNRIEAAKGAYRLLGLTGSIGIHQL